MFRRPTATSEPISIPTSIVVVLLRISTGVSPSWIRSWKRSSYCSVLLQRSSRWSLCESWAVCSSVSITWIGSPWIASETGFLQKLSASYSSDFILWMWVEPQLGHLSLRTKGVSSAHFSHLCHMCIVSKRTFTLERSIYSFPLSGCAESRNASFNIRFHAISISFSPFQPMISRMTFENSQSLSSP